MSDLDEATKAVGGKGTIIFRGDGDSPEVFTRIAEVKDITGPQLSAEQAEATHQLSPSDYREWLPSFLDGGEVGFNCNFLPNDDGQKVLQTDFENRTARNFRIEFPDPHTAASLAIGAGDAGVLFTAAKAGRRGNGISVQFTEPAADDATLAVTVNGRAIVVALGKTGGTIDSTAEDVRAAVAAHVAASSLVTPSNVGNGTGLAAAAAAANLTGGRGTIWAFAAYVSGFTPSAPVGGEVLSADVTLRTTGPVTFNVAP